MALLKVVMLSSWNSISGPKIEQLWFSDHHPIFHSSKEIKWNIKGHDIPKSCMVPLTISSMQSSSKKASDNEQTIEGSFLDVQKCLSMSGKLLINEIEGNKKIAVNSSRLYCLDREMMFSVIFHKQPWLDKKTNIESHCSCISVLIDSEKFSFHYDIHRIIDLHLRKVAFVLQQSSIAPSRLSKEITPMVQGMCEVIYSINSTKPPSVGLQEKSSLFQQFQHQIKFLCQAITSHIQTCGFSVVNGDAPYMVHQISKILLLFNTEQERKCSESCSELHAYHSGVNVQAIVKKQGSKSGLPSVIFKDFPITFIDISGQKVRQTISGSKSGSSSNLLQSITDCGMLVPQLVDDLIIFEENHTDIDNLIENFNHFLYMKAIALIKIMDKFSFNSTTPTEKQLLKLLNVKTVADLRVCLGRAERIKPGIQTSIA